MTPVTSDRIPKRIIVCCDDSSPSPPTASSTTPSNVARISRQILRTATDQDGQTWQQIVYYHPGIGDPASVISGHDELNATLAPHILQVYSFVSLNYSVGDKILLFGYAKGACVARGVASIITDIGVVPPQYLQDFQALYRLYEETNDREHFRRSKAWHDFVYGAPAKEQPVDSNGDHGDFQWDIFPHGLMWNSDATRDVEVIGLFGAVGSLGPLDPTEEEEEEDMGPRRQKSTTGLHDVKLSPYVKHAFHALALDETQEHLSPALWYLPKLGSPLKPAISLQEAIDYIGKSENEGNDIDKIRAWELLMDAESAQHLEDRRSELLQVWFPGVQSNIAGIKSSRLEKRVSDWAQIANITFAWMIEQVHSYLGFDEMALYQDMRQQDLLLAEPVTEKNRRSSIMVPLISWALDKTGLYEAGTRHIPKDIRQRLSTYPMIADYTALMSQSNSAPRYPGQCMHLPTRIPLSTLGDTNEAIHPLIRYRMSRIPTYTPEGLKGFIRIKRMDGRAGWEYVMKLIEYGVLKYVRVPEYVIEQNLEDHNNVERLIVEDEEAVSFLEEVDQGYSVKDQVSSKMSSLLFTK